ncbi:MAG: hypothetical protein HFJ09_03055 [Lachnospiraceae bacterium]|nr:hypothetical protein [Lachnospiraceae bacterium]
MEKLTIRDFIDNVSNVDETKLAKISDKLWEIGNLEEIKEKISSDLFYLHVGINMIGMWKGEGWWEIIAEQADFVPYIPITLDKLNLTELKTAFENIIKLFPEYTVFKSDDKAYYNIVNFLQSANLKVHDEKLQSISLEERRGIVKEIRKNVNILEDLTEPFWRDSSECGGWKQIVDFISSNVK